MCIPKCTNNSVNPLFLLKLYTFVETSVEIINPSFIATDAYIVEICKHNISKNSPSP